MQIARYVVQLAIACAICYWVGEIALGLTAYLIVSGFAFIGVLATLWHVYWGWWLSRDLVAAAALALVWPILMLAFGVHLLKHGSRDQRA
jgi:hypothetical protein